MALPIIAGMMVQTLFNVVDIMFIGWLGADEVTAVAFVSPLFFIIYLSISRVQHFSFETSTDLSNNAHAHICSESLDDFDFVWESKT